MISLAHEKFVMAKLNLPDDVKKRIKRYLPKMSPTPTARLIKELTFKRHPELPVMMVHGPSTRKFTLRTRWISPPCMPRIIRVCMLELCDRPEDPDEQHRLRFAIDVATGELKNENRAYRKFRLSWPCLDKWGFYESRDWYDEDTLKRFSQSPDACQREINRLNAFAEYLAWANLSDDLTM